MIHIIKIIERLGSVGHAQTRVHCGYWYGV